MLGGSGSHNGNTYNRGNPRDYDNWADLVQDQSWAYNNTLHDFKRFENFIGDLISDDFDGKVGHVKIGKVSVLAVCRLKVHSASRLVLMAKMVM
jgi:choline dehydrogenase-like flavoprotein